MDCKHLALLCSSKINNKGASCYEAICICIILSIAEEFLSCVRQVRTAFFRLLNFRMRG